MRGANQESGNARSHAGELVESAIGRPAVFPLTPSDDHSPISLRMLQMPSSGVLASLKASMGLGGQAPALPVPVPLFKQGQSPVGRVTVPFTRCGLAGLAFSSSPGFHPATCGLLQGTREPLGLWRFCNSLTLLRLGCSPLAASTNYWGLAPFFVAPVPIIRDDKSDPPN